MNRCLRMWAAISLLAVFVTLTLPQAPWTAAQSTNEITSFGCTIDPNKPDNDEGMLVARAVVECTTSSPDRTIVTELWRKTGSGEWKKVSLSGATLEAPDPILADSDADSNPVRCRNVTGTRKYKTVVTISDGSGGTATTESNPQELGRDCDTFEIDDVLPPGEDEVIVDGCTGDLCAASARLENHDYFYGCDVYSRNPLMTRDGTKFVGEGEIRCDTDMARRKGYAQVCDELVRYPDHCAELVSRVLDLEGMGRTFFPKCVAAANPPAGSGHQGNYTRTGIQPGKQPGGNRPPERHVNSPSSRYHWWCQH